jgi:hypothetical protein
MIKCIGRNHQGNGIKIAKNGFRHQARSATPEGRKPLFRKPSYFAQTIRSDHFITLLGRSDGTLYPFLRIL